MAPTPCSSFSHQCIRTGAGSVGSQPLHEIEPEAIWHGTPMRGLRSGLREQIMHPRSTDTSNDVKPVVGSVVGIATLSLLVIISWRIAMYYRRRHATPPPSQSSSFCNSPDEKSYSSNDLPLDDRQLLYVPKEVSTEPTAAVIYQPGESISQFPSTISSQSEQNVQEKITVIKVQEVGTVAPPAPVQFKKTEPQERLLKRLSDKLSVRRAPRPLPTPPMPTPELSGLSLARVPLSPPPNDGFQNGTSGEAGFSQGGSKVALKKSTTGAVPFAISKKLSAAATRRVIPPAPTNIPTGPLPSLPTGEASEHVGSSQSSPYSKKGSIQRKGRPPQLPLSKSTSTKTRNRPTRKQSLVHGESSNCGVITVNAHSQHTHNATTTITVPTQVQPEKSPARSDSFKKVHIPHSKSFNTERNTDEQMWKNTEQEIMEWFGDRKPVKTVKKKKGKRKLRRDISATAGPEDTENEPVPVPTVPVVHVTPPRVDVEPITPPSSSSSSSTSSPRLPRLVTTHKLYTPSLPDELRIELNEPLRLLAEYQDGWVLVERVGVHHSTRSPTSASEHSTPTEPERGVIPRFCITDRPEFVERVRSKGMRAVMREVEQSVRNLKGKSWSSLSSARRGGRRVPFGYGVMHGVER